jgi:uncharacterized protein
LSSGAPDVHLLDANVLVAMADAAHVHHLPATRWFAASATAFATCPMTQGALIRVLLRLEAVPGVAVATRVLQGFTAHPRHKFWADELDYAQINWKGVIGHRQVTDAYLAALARHNSGKLASFDRGLVALHPDVAVLVPG